MAKLFLSHVSLQNSSAILPLVLCAALCDDHYCYGRGDRGDRPGAHHGGPPPPPYLEDVTEEPSRKHFTIACSKGKTTDGQKQKILE
ncbi:unnamed protein product [Heligmosomoides polygyrus]|uniref:Secreted protein n=1 Tax=Heligmosomoides polygyrus TaxID=6339 RepID=A0A183FWC7_HELPZ|nr:unnamed protein product [Heligmosomoides polygyrus]